jgi:hypothetical protein
VRGCPPAVLFDPCCTPVAPAAPRLRTSRAGASRWLLHGAYAASAAPAPLPRAPCQSRSSHTPAALPAQGLRAGRAGRHPLRATQGGQSARGHPLRAAKGGPGAPGHPLRDAKGVTGCAWAPFTGRIRCTECAWAPFTGLKGWTGLCARPPLVWELCVDRVGLASASCRPRRTCWEPAVVAWRIRAGRTKLFRRPLQVSAPLTPAALAQPEPARLCTNTSANACPARGPHGMPWGRTPCHVSTRRNTTELPVRSMGRWWFLSGARGKRGAAGAVLSSRRGDRERPCRMWHCSPLLDFPGAPRPGVLLVWLVVQWDTHTTQYSVLEPNAAAPERIRPRGHFAAVPARENCMPLNRCGY